MRDAELVMTIIFIHWRRGALEQSNSKPDSIGTKAPANGFIVDAPFLELLRGSKYRADYAPVMIRNRDRRPLSCCGKHQASSAGRPGRASQALGVAWDPY